MRFFGENFERNFPDKIFGIFDIYVVLSSKHISERIGIMRSAIIFINLNNNNNNGPGSVGFAFA
ncbi:hypothetical protein IX53_05635 [Kosmotoga pacifica]|uniref:Uncharacterized protein n=1 Tax=Kosmotoga pacifica TaxID=1330330 RepID=A0A0G2Z750_9BACT|nr:hypothetical protein IX53_05635 [Kosmotoga pacifica]